MYSHTKYNSQYSHNQTFIWDHIENSNELITNGVVFSDVPSKEYNTERNTKKDYLQKYRKSVSERLKYLSDNLDDDQDREIFERSKKVVDKFISYAKTIDNPLISVDNTGYIVFEWRNYHQYDVVMILFKTTENISFVGIKPKEIILKASGIISKITKLFQKIKDE